MNKNLFLVSAFLLVFVYVNAQIPTNGLVAWYPFTGNTLDSSGNNNHGTNNGATLTTDRFGKANSAYSFNGSSNNISIGNFSNWDMYKSNFTMSVWFETNDTTHTREQMLIGKDSACSGPGQFRFEINEWGGSSPSNNISVVAIGLTNANQFRYFPLPNRKVWINAIIVKSNKNSFMYVNGNLVATYTNDTSVTLGSYSFNCYIGARLATPSCATKGNLVNFFWGKLDDIRIYNRTLDSASVQALYHEGGYDAPKTTIPTNGLVAWYPFTGNTLDSSGNNNHGTNNGATLTTDRFGKTNCAYQFNGTNGVSRIRVPDSKSLTVGSALTISLWVKYNSLANNDNILLEKGTYGNGISDGYNLYFDNNFGKLPYYEKGLLYGNGSSSYGIGDTSNLDNGWHHMLVVYNPSIGNRIYIDGKLKRQYQPSLCTSCKILNSTNPLYIGNTGFGIPWNGSIDDIRIYNTSIDSVGVQALYHEGGYATNSTIPSNGLVAWYPFTGNTLDSSGNNNHGTNNGATLTTDRFGKTNSAYLFNGSSGVTRIRVPDSKSLTVGSALTISLWVKYNSLANNANVFLQKGTGGGCLSTGYNLSYDNNFGSMPYMKGLGYGQNNICAGIVDSSNLDNNWHHIVVVYNPPSGNTIYFDGISKGKGNFSSCSSCTILNSTNPLYIGNTGFGIPWNGNIDDIRIYNKSIDSTGVQALYHEGGYLGIPLPVKFEDISGLKSGNAIKINWHSSTEQNTSLFIIQHSTDGTSFTDIGTVKAIGSGANGYSFTDNNPTTYPLNGVLYYRLKSVDKDGSSSYSKVISVQLTIDNFQLSIYPNPAKDKITLNANNIASIQVIDNLGRVVKTQTFKDATNPTLSLGGLQAGIYHLRVQTTDGKVSGVGFVKE